MFCCLLLNSNPCFQFAFGVGAEVTNCSEPKHEHRICLVGFAWTLQSSFSLSSFTFFSLPSFLEGLVSPFLCFSLFLRQHAAMLHTFKKDRRPNLLPSQTQWKLPNDLVLLHTLSQPLQPQWSMNIHGPSFSLSFLEGLFSSRGFSWSSSPFYLITLSWGNCNGLNTT